MLRKGWLIFLFILIITNVLAEDRFIIGTGDANNTIIDTTTGLMWERSPNIVNLSWINAVSYCENLNGSEGRGGYEDWRLPTIAELLSLVDYRFYFPTLSNTKGDGQLSLNSGDPFYISYKGFNSWSFTTALGFNNGADSAWGMNTKLGVATGYIKTTSNGGSAWCVRGLMPFEKEIICKNTSKCPKLDCPNCEETICTEEPLDCSGYCSNEKEIIYVNNCTDENSGIEQTSKNQSLVGVSSENENKISENSITKGLIFTIAGLIVFILILIYYFITRNKKN